MNRKCAMLAAALLSGAAVLTAFETPQEAINAASNAMKSKNYAEAHRCLDEGFKLSVNPTERVLVLTRRGEVYRTQNDWKNAEKMLMMIVNDKKMTPIQRASAWLNIARYKELQKKYEDAVDAYQSALELNKEGNQAQEALNKCGLLLTRLKDYTGAIECFNQVFTIPNKDARRSNLLKQGASTNIANTYVAMKQYDKAIKTLDEAAKQSYFTGARNQETLKKNIYRIYETQIREAIRFKKFADAEKALAELKKRDNSDRIISLEIYLLQGKAAVAARKRDYKTAEGYYQTAIKIATPTLKFGAYGALIQHCLIHKKYAEAEKAVKELQALPCTKVEEKYQINFWTYRYLNITKKYADAIKVMEETAKIKGLPAYRLANCYGLICSTYFSGLKDKAKAAEYYKKAAAGPRGNWKNAYLKKQLGL